MFFGSLTIAINGLPHGFFYLSTIAFNGFRWLWTIGQRCNGCDGSLWSDGDDDDAQVMIVMMVTMLR